MDAFGDMCKAGAGGHRPQSTPRAAYVLPSPREPALTVRPHVPPDASRHPDPRASERAGICRVRAGWGDAFFAVLKGNTMTDEQAALCVQAYWRRYLSVIYYQVY